VCEREREKAKEINQIAASILARTNGEARVQPKEKKVTDHTQINTDKRENKGNISQ